MTKQQFYTALGLRVRSQRTGLGLNQTDLGKKIKKCTSYVSEIECGYRHISAFMVYSLEKEIGRLRD